MKNKQDIYKITAIIIIIDQIVKLLVDKNMKLFEEIKIIPNFFSIYYVQNTGAAFSILKDSSVFLVIISVIFLVALDRYLKKEAKDMNKILILAFGLIMGGIYGNLIDRIIYHYVIDYLSFTFFGYSFAIFNIADIGITVGVALILLDTFRKKKKEWKRYLMN